MSSSPISTTSSVIKNEVMRERDRLLSSRFFSGMTTRSDLVEGHSLDYWIKRCMEEHPNDANIYPAVDLSAGYGTMAVNLSLRYRRHTHHHQIPSTLFPPSPSNHYLALPGCLEFTPAAPDVEDLKKALQFMKDEEHILEDVDTGIKVYARDHVNLTGLTSRTDLNGTGS